MITFRALYIPISIQHAQIALSIWEYFHATFKSRVEDGSKEERAQTGGIVPDCLNSGAQTWNRRNSTGVFINSTTCFRNPLHYTEQN